MENTKKIDIHDCITPEFLAHYFNAEYKAADRVRFTYITTTRNYKVIITKNIISSDWRIWCDHYGIEESKTVLKSINDLITALFLFGVPALAVKIKNDCLTSK